MTGEIGGDQGDVANEQPPLPYADGPTLEITPGAQYFVDKDGLTFDVDGIVAALRKVGVPDAAANSLLVTVERRLFRPGKTRPIPETPAAEGEIDCHRDEEQGFRHGVHMIFGVPSTLKTINRELHDEIEFIGADWHEEMEEPTPRLKRIGLAIGSIATRVVAVGTVVPAALLLGYGINKSPGLLESFSYYLRGGLAMGALMAAGYVAARPDEYFIKAKARLRSLLSKKLVTQNPPSDQA